MILKINGFKNQIIFDKKTVNILEIKHIKCFSHIIQVLNNKINGIETNEIFLLDELDNELNMNNNMYMLIDIFNIEYNSKKIISQIYNIIANNIMLEQNIEFKDEITKLRKIITE